MVRGALRTPTGRVVVCFSVILIFATSSILSLGASGEANPPVATEWVNTMPGFPGRSIHSAALHQASGRMIVFGGYDGNPRNDLWYLDNATGSAAPPVWSMATPTNTPPPGRFGHTAVYGQTSNRMTVFGGHSGSTYQDDVFVLRQANGLSATADWAQLSPIGTPPSIRGYHSAVYDSPANQMLVFGGTDGATRFNEVWKLTNANGFGGTPVWILLAPTGTPPDGRSDSVAVLDTANDRMTIFGGFTGVTPSPNDSWVLENATGDFGPPRWTQLATAGTPPTWRSGHSAEYNVSTNRMVVFGGTAGGNHYNQVYVLENANGLGGTPTWSLLSPSGTKPAARYRHSAVYDSGSNRMVIFGGQDANRYSDSWLLKNASGLGGTSQWSLLLPSNPPPAARSAHSAIYDGGSDRMTVFGGSSGTSLNDLWLLENASSISGDTKWRKLAPTGTLPTTRSEHTAIYAPASNRMVVFGGSSIDTSAYLLQTANGLGGTPAWSALGASGTPPPVRSSHSAVYDPVENRMTIFGGVSGVTRMNDVWLLENASGLGGTPTWKNITPAGTSPERRYWHSAVLDAPNNRMIIFGGQNQTGTRLNDVWVLLNANGLGGEPSWSQLSPTGTKPAARRGHSAVYDPLSNNMVVFAGLNLNDLWLLEEANGLGGTPAWMAVAAGGTPPAGRSDHSAIYDATNNRMVVFGGFNSVAVVRWNEVWVLREANGLPVPEFEMTMLIVTGVAILLAALTAGTRVRNHRIPPAFQTGHCSRL